MTRCNRIDPWSDLHADPARGLFTGNRGPLVDDDRRIVRHHASSTLWITCVLRFRDWRHPLDQPHIWTPLFFLDDAVALAAGHRPCAFCRRPDYRAYRDAIVRRRAGVRRRWRSTVAWPRSGCGGAAASHERRTARCGAADVASLPAGAVLVHEAHGPCLVGRETLQAFTFAGWGAPFPRPCGEVAVLTPPTSIAALDGGFTLTLHASAVT